MGRFKDWREEYLEEVVAHPAHPCFNKEDEEESFNKDIKEHLELVDGISFRGIDYEVYENIDPDDHDLFFVSDSEYGYDLSVGYNKDVFGKNQIYHVCKNPDSDRKGLPSDVYLNYLLPKGGELVSDLTQTTEAFKFWQNLYGKVQKASGVYFYVMSYEGSEPLYKELESLDDMNTYYGKDNENPFYEDYAFVITNSPREVE